MKKRNLLLVMLAIMLVFGMMMSCEPIEDDGDDGEDGEDWELDDGFFGTYVADKYNGTLTETIVFSKNSFKISDDSNKSGNSSKDEYLEFSIDEFDEFPNVPASIKSDYPQAFIFKGTITAAYEVTTTYIYGTQTGPDLKQSDIDDGTLLKMLIFYNIDTGKFVRTAFLKANASISESNLIRVTQTAGAALRVYSEK
jgi:hypothetical protein